MVQKLDPRRTGKKIIGLTGSFGSGKSTVAHFFSELGAEVIDADRLAHEALEPGSPVYAEIRSAFAEAALKGREGLDHKALAEIIFTNQEKRKKLEGIIHPYVFERIAEEVSQSEESIVLVDVPLLFESGYDQFCDKVIVVKAPEDVINRRLSEKGFSREAIAARRKAQLPLEDKIKRASIILDNSETFQKTRRDVEKVWKDLHPASKGV